MVLHPSTWYFILHPKVNHHRDQSKSEVHLKAGRRREGWKCIKEPNLSLINHSSLLLLCQRGDKETECIYLNNFLNTFVKIINHSRCYCYAGEGGKGMYSSDLLNAFVQIAKFVCPNFQIKFTKLPNKITFINSDPGISKTHFWCIF